MRIYQLYLIDDEFASHYFGRENMFFQLFKEYKDSFGEMQRILARQIQFISKPIPSIRVHQSIHQHLHKKKGYETNKGRYYMESGRNSYAILEVMDRFIELKAEGNFEAETIFFEVLRKNERSFLAIDLLNERCGWLKPIKERKFV